MTAVVLDGKSVAAGVLADVGERAGQLAQSGIHPCLVFVTIGDSPPAELYGKRLERLGERYTIRVARHGMPDTITVSDLEHEVVALSCDPSVDGILVQMPLPPHLEPARLSLLIDPRKDVDGITVHNAGRLYLGLPGQIPPTAAAMVQILDSAGIGITGKHAVIVGRSNIVGHPLAELLLYRDATVTVTHRQTPDLALLTRQADVLMVAAGEAGLIQADMLKRGVAVVDAGINVTPDGVVGDVDFERCKQVASAITPVPGGVGPVTNAVLLRHVVRSAEERDS